jgi:hypothetical protein
MNNIFSKNLSDRYLRFAAVARSVPMERRAILRNDFSTHETSLWDDIGGITSLSYFIDYVSFIFICISNHLCNHSISNVPEGHLVGRKHL